MRCKRREATVQECTEIEDKRKRKLSAIFDSELEVSRDTQSGYQSTWHNFVVASQNTDASAARKGGESKVDSRDDNPLVFSLFPYVAPIINDCSRHMKPFLHRMGVDDDELSPFCQVFETPSDLLGSYDDYFSGSKIFEEEVNVDGIGMAIPNRRCQQRRR